MWLGIIGTPLREIPRHFSIVLIPRKMPTKLKIAMFGYGKLIDKPGSWNAILFWREAWPFNDFVVPFMTQVLDSGQERTFKYRAPNKATSLLSWLSDEITKWKSRKQRWKPLAPNMNVWQWQWTDIPQYILQSGRHRDIRRLLWEVNWDSTGSTGLKSCCWSSPWLPWYWVWLLRHVLWGSIFQAKQVHGLLASFSFLVRNYARINNWKWYKFQ